MTIVIVYCDVLLQRRTFCVVGVSNEIIITIMDVHCDVLITIMDIYCEVPQGRAGQGWNGPGPQRRNHGADHGQSDHDK